MGKQLTRKLLSNGCFLALFVTILKLEAETSFLTEFLCDFLLI